MPGTEVFETALSQLDSRVLFVSANGDIEFCDTAVSNELGYDRETLLEFDLFDALVPDEKQTDAYQAFTAITNVRELDELETPIRTAAGERRSISWLESVDNGDQTIVIGRLTAQRSASTSFFDQEINPYRTMVEHFPNGMITLFDEEHRFRLGGGPVLDEIDLLPENLRGKRLPDVFPESNVAELRPLFQGAFEGETNSITLPLEDRFFEIRTLPVRDDTGEIVAGISVSQDVTARKERERQLQEARDRYEMLIEDAPIPIFVVDQLGNVEDLNRTAAELAGRPREDIVGGSMVSLHPSGQEEQYREAIQSHASEGGTRRRLPDGEQLYIVDNEGERIPIEVNVSVTEENRGKRVHGFFRDISDYVWYENALEELHESANKLVRSETEGEAAQTIVETAVDSLDLQLVSVHLTDTEAEKLSPVAYSNDVPDLIGSPPSLPLTDSVAGEAFLENKTIRVDDVRSRTEVYNPDTSIRGQLIAPIGEFGVIVCCATTVDSFDREDQHLLELLARNAESVFTRINREQTLRKHERELESKTETLQRVEEINTGIRKLTRIAVHAENRTELEEQVCEFLTRNDQFVFGWIGELSPEGDELRARTWAGEGQGYLDTCSLSLEGDSLEPAVQTAETTTPTVVSNVAADARQEPWRRAALRRNFSSVLSVPIMFQDVLYGVLTLYGDAYREFTERERDVLTDWCEFMGYAIKEIERTSAILSEQGTAFRFEIESEACPLLRIARESHCTLSFEGLHEQHSGETTVFVRVIGCTTKRFLEDSKQAAVISSITQINDSDEGGLFQLTISDSFIASTLAKYGIRLQTIVSDDGGGVHIRVVSPPTIPAHRTVEIILSEYPNSTLVETTEQTEDIRSRDQFTDHLMPKLTDRQQEALELAYHGGYFQSPKNLNGAELADQMGISSSSFSTHLRTAERKLLASLFGAPSPPKLADD